jgi:predicted nucleotidyltransferase
MIDITREEMEIVLNIIAEYAKGSEIIAFGSRCNGTALKYSDLDLSFSGLDLYKKYNLKEAFEESDLPFSVDVIDFDGSEAWFQEIIAKSGFSLNILNETEELD